MWRASTRDETDGVKEHYTTGTATRRNRAVANHHRDLRDSLNRRRRVAGVRF
jgi:hypothetical protein